MKPSTKVLTMITQTCSLPTFFVNKWSESQFQKNHARYSSRSLKSNIHNQPNRRKVSQPSVTSNLIQDKISRINFQRIKSLVRIKEENASAVPITRTRYTFVIGGVNGLRPKPEPTQNLPENSGMESFENPRESDWASVE